MKTNDIASVTLKAVLLTSVLCLQRSEKQCEEGVSGTWRKVTAHYLQWLRRRPCCTICKSSCDLCGLCCDL